MTCSAKPESGAPESIRRPIERVQDFLVGVTPTASAVEAGAAW